MTLPDKRPGAGWIAAAAIEPVADVRLDGVRVLVVDDEKDTRELIGRALEDRGARISVAATSQDAIEILERDEIDVLLADIAMPGEDGYSLIQQDSRGPKPAGLDSGGGGHGSRAGGRAHPGAGGGLSRAYGQAGRAERDRPDGESPGARSARHPPITRVVRGRAA